MQISKWFYTRRKKSTGNANNRKHRFSNSVKRLLDKAIQRYVLNPQDWEKGSKNRLDLQTSTNLSNLQVQRYFNNNARKIADELEALHQKHGMA